MQERWRLASPVLTDLETQLTAWVNGVLEALTPMMEAVEGWCKSFIAAQEDAYRQAGSPYGPAEDYSNVLRWLRVERAEQLRQERGERIAVLTDWSQAHRRLEEGSGSG